MKSAMIIFLMILATSCFSSTAYSQTKQSAVETVQDLKLQLIELDARQETAKLQVHKDKAQPDIKVPGTNTSCHIILLMS